jgi:predicted TIM-barrel fold metal-dependent hydrolase
MGYEILRLPFEGAVDGDGHVLEPADLWENYLEDKYKDRGIHIKVDDEGLEYLEFDNVAQQAYSKGLLSTIGAMGDADVQPSPDRRYMDVMPYGACDPAQRVDLLDQEHLDNVVLFPTIGLMWQNLGIDPELELAYARAYNRWIADFCRDSKGRLVASAQIPLANPVGAAEELERAVADGCKGAFVGTMTHTAHLHGHPHFDVVWAKAQELDVPLGIHPGVTAATEGVDTGDDVDDTTKPDDMIGECYVRAIAAGNWVRPAFLSFFDHGTFDRFPKLKLGVLESQAGWIASLLDRLDQAHETVSGSVLFGRAPLKEKPSYYFKRNCFISTDPSENSAALIMDYVGSHCFQWASDYPHLDHPASWVTDLKRLVEPLSADTRNRLLGQNVKDLYHLS